MRFLKQTGIVLLATLAGFVYWQWASQPLWSSSENNRVRYHSHDTSRQELMLFVTRQGDHYLETRHMRTGVLLSQVVLPWHEANAGDIYVPWDTRSMHDDHALVILRLIHRESNEDISIASIYERGNGRKITPKVIDMYWRCDTQSCGRRAAISTSHEVLLFEFGLSEPRRLPIHNVTVIRILPCGAFLACLAHDKLHIIDWASGKIVFSKIQSSGSYDTATMGCTRNGDIILGSGDGRAHTFIERWRWDGKELVEIAPRAVFKKPFTHASGILNLCMTEDEAGRLHVAQHVAVTWPSPWRDWIPWLKEHTGISLGNYLETKMIIFWYVLRSDNTVERRYEDSCSDLQFLGGDSHLLVKTRYDFETKSLSTIVVSTIPAWPNAMAISMMVYLLIYLYRHRRRRV